MFNFPMAPPSASNFASGHDALFYVLCFLTLIFTVIVGIGVIFFAVRYKEGSKADRSRPVYENLALELTWSIIPLILGVIMFFFGAKLYVAERIPPKDAQEVYVIGKQWMWHAQHAQSGIRENNVIHLPIDKPVRFTCISQDVLHALYIPAFRIQVHVVPGRYTSMWCTPTKVGEYHLFCNMYCGTQHSEMGGKVVVMEQKDYAAWLANGGQTLGHMSSQQAGERLYNKIGCNNCHGAKDSPQGPSLYGIYGKIRKFSNSAPVKADEEYLRESILRPYNKLVVGYGKEMPSYEGSLNEEDVLNLIAYIKSLGSSLPAPTNGLATARDGVDRVGENDNASSLTTNAMRAGMESSDVTPTLRKKTPAVGAIAAENR